MEVRVLLDHNVIIKYCAKKRHRDFFYYLESHPNLGIIAKKPYEDIKKVIRNRERVHDYENVMSEYYKLPSYIEIKEFNSEYHKIFPEVREFLFNLVKENQKTFSINLGAVSSRYRGLANEICRVQDVSNKERKNLDQKIFHQIPEHEDMRIIAEAISLKSEHKFIASEDGHFIEPFVSSAIEEKFKIKCRHPNILLHEIKQYEHLFNEKLIL